MKRIAALVLTLAVTLLPACGGDDQPGKGFAQVDKTDGP